ncbi:hypothetical protein FRB95_004206 [Tulasnella sp. JGI-2019a]|nr:hypothetical protein FRB95_004206 [Tulasnella sp. JGI-2019a]
MPLAQRRPTILKLSLPHPPLSCLQSPPSNNLPHDITSSPANANPVTPVNPQRRDNFRPRSSIDSWCSTDSGMSCEYDWTTAHIAILQSALDNIPSHLFTPFVGSVPPQNVLQTLARGVKDGKDHFDWPHSIKSTRLMLHRLAAKRAKASPLAEVAENTIVDGGSLQGADASKTPENGNKTTATSGIPIVHKDSMDSLASTAEARTRALKENPAINRASSRLQARADRFFTFHPYAAARSRQTSGGPFTPTDPTSVPELLPPVSETAPRRILRRTASSTSSHLATVNELGVAPASPMLLTPNRLPMHRTSNPCLARQYVRRSDSFVRPNSMGATIFAEESFGDSGIGQAMGAAGGAEEFAVPAQRQAMKRAPSYGVAVHQRKEEKEKEKIKPVTELAQTPKKPSSRDKDAMVTPVVMKTPSPSTRPKPMIGITPSPTPTVSSPCTTNHSPTNTHTNGRSLSPAVYSSDEEEKKRSKTIKRFKAADPRGAVNRKYSLFGPELPLQRASSTEGQTITVEEYTLASMTSMESLASAVPSLSASSSLSTLSMTSVEAFGTDQAKRQRATSNRKVARPIPPQLAMPTSTPVVRKGKEQPKLVASPQALSQSASPPRTLRRVGNKSIKLEPFIATSSSPSTRTNRPTQTPKRPHGLSELSRTLSFGGGSPSASSSAQSMAGLLGAAFGLDSPFEEKKPSSKVKGGQYLF